MVSEPRQDRARTDFPPPVRLDPGHPPKGLLGLLFRVFPGLGKEVVARTYPVTLGYAERRDLVNGLNLNLEPDKNLKPFELQRDLTV